MVFTVINDRNNLRTTYRRKATIKLIDLSRMFSKKTLTSLVVPSMEHPADTGPKENPQNSPLHDNQT